MKLDEALLKSAIVLGVSIVVGGIANLFWRGYRVSIGEARFMAEYQRIKAERRIDHYSDENLKSDAINTAFLQFPKWQNKFLDYNLPIQIIDSRDPALNYDPRKAFVRLQQRIALNYEVNPEIDAFLRLDATSPSYTHLELQDLAGRISQKCHTGEFERLSVFQKYVDL